MTHTIKKSKDTIILDAIGYTFLAILGIASVLPFLILISGSLSDEATILIEGYSIIPKKISFDAYKAIFMIPELIIDAYGITLFITIFGTVISLFIITMTAYVLSRKDFEYRNKFTFYFYFTTLFNGGLVSYYIMMIRYYGMKDNIIALIVPMIINIFYLLMMRNFITQTIPDALVESAKIDGAGDFKIFISVVFPLMTPALASIGLFIALGYWNDWYNAMLFLNSPDKYPLQYVLYRIISAAQNLSLIASNAQVEMKMPKETIKLAMTVVAVGPVIFAYPFVQKYFVKGITMGAVKG